MKLRAEDVAELLGITVKTVYNHRDKGKLSFEKDGSGVESSEIERAYKSKYPDIGKKLIEFYEKQNISKTSVKEEGDKPSKKSAKEQESVQLAVLEKELEMLNAQMEKERKLYENQIENLKESLSTAQKGHLGIVRLLEDRSKEENGEALLQKQVSRLEQKVENDNSENKELKMKLNRLEEEKQQRLDKIRKSIKQFKKELPVYLKRIEGQGGDVALFEVELKEISSMPVTNNENELENINSDFRNIAKRIKIELARLKKEKEVQKNKSFIQKLFG